jgi:hypothetical protein
MPDENLKGTKKEHSNFGSPLRVDDPDLPTPVSPPTSDNIVTTRSTAGLAI